MSATIAKWLRPIRLGIILGVAAGIPGGPVTARASTPSEPQSSPSLRVFPDEISLTASQASHRILITRINEQGLEVDVTPLASYSSDDSAVATVTSDGVIQPIKEGTATVLVTEGAQTARVKVRVNPPAAGSALSFVNDVLPVLSKAGCNAGACHAKKEGQNGFKLSVFAYDPKSDYQEIVNESRGRRVFPACPEESLILKKPTMMVGHQGGKRFEPASKSYQTLRNWIHQGMPYGGPADPTLEAITAYPAERSYAKGAEQPLLVRARYSDGTLRDVTDLSDFRSTEKDLAKVDEEGHVQVGSLNGEGVIVARFMGLVDISRITVPADRVLPDSAYASLPVKNKIDELAYARHRKLGLVPSDPCGDSEFLRRASLDAIGRLPAPGEVKSFLESKNSEKREELIDRLLQDKAYADHWAIKWGDLIRPNPSRVGVKSVYLLDLWLRERFRENTPYDRMVAELLTAQGSTHQYGPAVVFRDHRKPEDAGTFVSQIFLGVRMECAQCHHHPNEKWSQNDYYQLAAFFSQVKRKGQGISAPISGLPEFIYHAPGGSVKNPVTGEVLPPKPPDGPAPQIEDGRDPRAVLAQWLSDPENPFFARAIVNRVWAEFMGRGIVHPVDDFRASNPPTNQPLLDWLAREFVEHHYDLKHLMRTIMNSHLYQLSSLPNETNLADPRNFSRAYRRRLPAEVLLDAISDLTGLPESFQGTPPGTRAVETWNNKLSSEFMDAFGRPNASAECPCERDRQTSVVQALHLMNSNRLQDKISNKKARARRLAESDLTPEQIVDELYLAAYSRPPAAEELSIAVQAFSEEDTSRQTATEDIIWALINSAEFVFNH